MDGNRVWYWVHFGFTVALAVLSAVSVVLLATDSNLPPVNSFGGVIIFVFVVPGTLLVFAINHLLLWRRKPRVIRTSDKVVIIIVAALILAAMAATIDEEFGFGAVFVVVPLLMIAGVVSTIVILVGNARAAAPVVATGQVEPGSAPVAATLDELFPEQPAAPEPLAPAPPTGETPYGPRP